MLLAGPQYMPRAYCDTPLARLLPFDARTVIVPEPGKPLTEGFVAQPTDLGLASPAMQLGDTPEQTRAIWQHLPPLYWMIEAAGGSPGCGCWPEHPTRTGRDGRRLPVIALQYVGSGKVLFHASDETWRLARAGWATSSSPATGSKPSAPGPREARRRSARGRAHDRPPRVSPRRRGAAAGAVRRRTAGAAEDRGVTVMVEQQRGKKQPVGLRRAATGRGTFEGLLGAMPVGSYHAWMVTPELPGQPAAVDFTVAPPPGEFARVRMDAAEMQQAALETSGRFYTFADADHLLADLPPGRPVPYQSLPPVPLWNKWPVLLVFLVLLIGEWLLRKRGGMV